MRENAGFKIIVAVPIGKNAPYGTTEVVIGSRESSQGDQYVCWFCEGGVNYYWGRYSSRYEDVITALIDRLSVYHSEELKHEFSA